MWDSLKQLSFFSAPEISDALDACGVEGALLSIKSLSLSTKLIGPAYTIQYLPYEEKPTYFRGAANYIDSVPAGSVVVIDNGGRLNCTTWGGILTQVALKKGIVGTVVYGAIRDVSLIRELQYPVFCSSIYMRSGKNRVYKAHEQGSLMIEGIKINPGDIMFGDDHGVLVIPIYLMDEVIRKVKNIRANEKNIMAAIQSGSTLAEAREAHHYEQPWLDLN